MTSPKKGSSPDWSDVFTRRPDLEPPGYREACRAQQQATDSSRPQLKAKAKAKPKRKR